MIIDPARLARAKAAQMDWKKFVSVIQSGEQKMRSGNLTEFMPLAKGEDRAPDQVDRIHSVIKSKTYQFKELFRGDFFACHEYVADQSLAAAIEAYLEDAK